MQELRSCLGVVKKETSSKTTATASTANSTTTNKAADIVVPMIVPEVCILLALFNFSENPSKLPYHPELGLRSQAAQANREKTMSQGTRKFLLYYTMAGAEPDNASIVAQAEEEGNQPSTKKENDFLQSLPVHQEADTHANTVCSWGWFVRREMTVISHVTFFGFYTVLYSRQSELGSMIEGCAVLGDELASWRNECKTIAKLISTLCEGSSEEHEQGTLDHRSSSEADVVMRVCLDDKKFEYLRS
ncbi:hypothetical protein JOM56_012905 [Amanita muscaria]